MSRPATSATATLRATEKPTPTGVHPPRKPSRSISTVSHPASTSTASTSSAAAPAVSAASTAACR